MSQKYFRSSTHAASAGALEISARLCSAQMHGALARLGRVKYQLEYSIKSL